MHDEYVEREQRLQQQLADETAHKRTAEMENNRKSNDSEQEMLVLKMQSDFRDKEVKRLWNCCGCELDADCLTPGP